MLSFANGSPHTHSGTLLFFAGVDNSNLSNVCHRYKTYLQSVYEKVPVAADDALPLVPCDEFINLDKTGLKKEDSELIRASFHGGVDEIRGCKIRIDIDSILTPESNCVLVEGPAGIGKSTLCQKLCREWDTLKSLQGYKIVLQLKLRDSHVQNASSLEEIFYHDDKNLQQSVVAEVFECNGEGVLLILDGFDELPGSVVSSQNSMIMRLINGVCILGARRLITSRPSALHHFLQQKRHVEILGFTDEYKKQYAEKVFMLEPDLITHFKSFIFSNPVITSLMYIPINCAIIAAVYRDIKSSREWIPRTMTQLYTTLTIILIKRYMIKKGKWNVCSDVPRNLKDLPEEIRRKLVS